MPNNHSLTLLDIGNVLLKLHPERFAEKCAAMSSRSLEEVHRFWSVSDRTWDYVRGKISERDFFREMADWLALTDGQLDELKVHWSDIFSEMPGARQAMRNFRTHGPLWICSDTEPVHVRWIGEKYPWVFKVDRRFLSHERGVLKSDPGAFSPIIEAAPVPPEQILFFDDLPQNVEAAREAGIDARLFTSWNDALSYI